MKDYNNDVFDDLNWLLEWEIKHLPYGFKNHVDFITNQDKLDQFWQEYESYEMKDQLSYFHKAKSTHQLEISMIENVNGRFLIDH